MAELANDEDVFGDDVISTYSRAQAIADGVLIDVTLPAREAGFAAPVALTIGAWQICVAWSNADEALHGDAGQSERGRLWDVLKMLWFAIRTQDTPPGDPLYYHLGCISNATGLLERVTLVAQCGPGDQAELIITVMCPGED